MRFSYEQLESFEGGRKREREKNKKHSVGDDDVDRLTLVQGGEDKTWKTKRKWKK